MAQNLWFPREFKESFGFEGQKWVQAVIDRLAGTGDNAATLRNLFNDNTILKADTDNIPEPLEVGEQTLVGRVTGGQIAALPVSLVKDLLGIEDLTVKEDAAISESATITNADFETGDLTGWTTTSDAGPGPTVISTDPLPGSLGSKPASWDTYYVDMGPSSALLSAGDTNTLSQSIDISGLSEDLLARIDSGEASFTLQWDHAGLAGAGGADDDYSVTATFKTSGGTTIATAARSTRPVPSAIELAQQLPSTEAPGCRTVDIEFTVIDNDTSSPSRHEYFICNVALLVTADVQVVSPVTTIVVDAGKLQQTGPEEVTLDLSGTALTVEEVDGSPSVDNVIKIVVSNGRLSNNGGGEVLLDLIGSGGSALIGTYTPSGASEVDIDLPSGELSVKIVFELTVSSDGADILARLTTDSFSTVDSGASDYAWTDDRNNTSTNTLSANNADSSIMLITNVGSDTGEWVHGRVYVMGYDNSNVDTLTQTFGGRLNTSSTVNWTVGGGGRRATNQQEDGIRIYPSAGTITGTIKVYTGG